MLQPTRFCIKCCQWKFEPEAAVCLGRVVEVAEPGKQAEAALEVGAHQPRRERDLAGGGLALAEEQVMADVVGRRCTRVEDEVVLLLS